MRPATEQLAAFIGGFVAAEGCFTGDGDRRFVFSVGLGATDHELCEAFRCFFGLGRVSWRSRRLPHYDDESTFIVSSLRELVEVIVPFMDEHLPPSAKRRQYLRWRSQLFTHWETRSRQALRPR